MTAGGPSLLKGVTESPGRYSCHRLLANGAFGTKRARDDDPGFVLVSLAEPGLVVSHGPLFAFQMAEGAIPRQMLQQILRLIAERRSHRPDLHETPMLMRSKRDRREDCCYSERQR